VRYRTPVFTQLFPWRFHITIIWQNELFNGKELKAKHIIFVDLFHSNAGKNVK
jgi:hypothetical protein